MKAASFPISESERPLILPIFIPFLMKAMINCFQTKFEAIVLNVRVFFMQNFCLAFLKNFWRSQKSANTIEIK